MTIDDDVPAWPKENVLDRIGRCRLMLSIHGFVSDAESRRIRDRITKWIKAEESRLARQAQVSGGRNGN